MSISSLLYADDLCLISDSHERIENALNKVDNWCQLWHMSIGVDKCGYMICNPSTYAPSAPLILNRTREIIPEPQSYRYLGFDITCSLDTDHVLNARYSKANLVCQKMMPILSNRSIPLGLKGMLIKSLFIPSFTYGLEFCLKTQQTFVRFQRLVDKCIRVSVFGKNSPSRTSMHVLYLELNIPPVYCIILGNCSRMICKYPTLTTIVSDIFKLDVTPRTFLHRITLLLKKIIPSFATYTDPSSLRDDIIMASWNRISTMHSSSRSLSFYREHSLHDSRQIASMYSPIHSIN